MDFPEDIEKAFQELDKKSYWAFASTLASYLQALMEKGFTRREAMKLVDEYAKFVYEWALEEALDAKQEECLDEPNPEDNSD